jgi:hypothetical protein
MNTNQQITYEKRSANWITHLRSCLLRHWHHSRHWEHTPKMLQSWILFSWWGESANDCTPIQRCTNTGRQVARATKFCVTAPNICVSSIWNLLCVTLLVPQNFHVDSTVLENVCTPGVYLKFTWICSDKPTFSFDFTFSSWLTKQKTSEVSWEMQ